MASEGGHKNVIQLLLDQGADIHARCRNGGTAIQIAARRGHESIVMLLLERGADITPCLIAILGGGFEPILRLSLDRNEDINATDLTGRTANMVQFLLDQGAEINAAGDEGDAALHKACSHDNTPVVKLLLDRGADVNAFGRNGTPLHAASFTDISDLIRLLLDRGADIHAETSDSERPLYKAVQCSRVQTISLLLEWGTNPNQGGGLSSPLHTASAYGNLEVVQMLLDYGAIVNAHKPSGTALHEVAGHCFYGGDHEEVLRLLVNRGAHHHAVDVSGRTALDVVATWSQRGTDMESLLLEMGAKRNKPH